MTLPLPSNDTQSPMLPSNATLFFPSLSLYMMFSLPRPIQPSTGPLTPNQRASLRSCSNHHLCSPSPGLFSFSSLLSQYLYLCLVTHISVIASISVLLNILDPILDCDLLEGKDLGHIMEAQSMHVNKGWASLNPRYAEMILHVREKLNINLSYPHSPSSPHILLHFEMQNLLLIFRITNDICHWLSILCLCISVA